MDSLDCAAAVLGVFVVYKLFDWLLRWPTVGQYSDRYIVITGCDSGFGQAAARRLDKLGCHIFAGCFTEAGQMELSRTCSERITPFQLNITSHDSVLQALDFVKSRLPSGKGLWAILNNAGIAGTTGPNEWVAVNDYKEALEVNLLGMIDMTMTFMPLIKKSRGRVVNTGSMAGRISLPRAAPYTVSKYGVEAFTDSIRRSLRPYGCKVMLIEPGIYRTNINNRASLTAGISRAWNNTSAEIKEEFGEEFYKLSVEALVKDFEKMSAPDINPVVDAYQHALLGSFPRARYVVGYDSKFLWLPLSFTPEWFIDAFLSIVDSTSQPVPAILKKRKID